MESAKVSSIDALRGFRAALIKFAETAGSAITDADGDVRSTMIWLERDQLTYWKGQIRKRHDDLERAKEALRHKELFKSPHGGRASVVDEQKALARCKAALTEAEQKLINTKKSAMRLQKQMSEFTGQLQRLGTTVQSRIPAGVADLDRMVALLDQYVSMHAPAAATSSAEAESASMLRAVPDAAHPNADSKSLRKHTPTPATRAAVLPGLVAFGSWKTPEIKIAQLDALSTLNLSQVPITDDQIVILARDVSDAENVYLERMAPAFSNDSGWYIGDAHSHASDQKLVALKVAEVLAMRSDFNSVLSFPLGSLLALDSNGIATILDARDRDLWADIRLSVNTTNPAISDDDPDEEH